MSEQPQALDPKTVEAFVANAHGDLEYVREKLAREPRLANATWDRGDGDWESALGAASHTGQREIALLLLAHGARLDLFAAAMLGYGDVVGAALERHPEMRDAKGPHGIPLVEHARVGGVDAQAVLELLEAASAEVVAGVGSTEPPESGAPALPARERI